MDNHAATSKCFLVVDDEALVRNDIAETVRDCGFSAWEAGSTSEALGILEHAGQSFYGLITDINMPGTRSGVVLANHVRTMWPHIRIIVVSAGRRPFAGELPERTPFIPKPWTSEQLSSAIAQGEA